MEKTGTAYHDAISAISYCYYYPYIFQFYLEIFDFIVRDPKPKFSRNGIATSATNISENPPKMKLVQYSMETSSLRTRRSQALVR